jgi:hypothetical protein
VNARFTSAAETELREAVAFYEAAENTLGAVFLDEVEAAMTRIAAQPASAHSTENSEEPGKRIGPVRDFWIAETG